MDSSFLSSLHDYSGRRFACRECGRHVLTAAELQDGDRCESCWLRRVDQALARGETVATVEMAEVL